MRVAITVPAYNAEKHIAQLLEVLIQQTRMPDEIIIVDDGSTDATSAVIQRYAEESSIIKYIYQNNSGPAAARNKAWRSSNADICIFTDTDCIPRKNWIEELLKPFTSNDVGAAGGNCKTINTYNVLARFIGCEYDWRYKNVKDEIDAHSSYNLAVRRCILEDVGGYNEEYPVASGEDWDMTYKISRKYKIIFMRTAIVGHYHPERFWRYMKTQMRRAFDRVKLYNDHPDKTGRDSYTGRIEKYQILASVILIPAILLAYPWFGYSFVFPLAIFLFLCLLSAMPFLYIAKRDMGAAWYGIFVRFVRNYAWLFGICRGMLRFGMRFKRGY